MSCRPAAGWDAKAAPPSAAPRPSQSPPSCPIAGMAPGRPTDPKAAQQAEAHPPNQKGKQLTKGLRTHTIKPKRGRRGFVRVAMATASPEERPRTFTFRSFLAVVVVAPVASPLGAHCSSLAQASPPDGCWAEVAQLGLSPHTDLLLSPALLLVTSSFKQHRVHLHLLSTFCRALPAHTEHHQQPQSITGIHKTSPGPMEQPQYPQSIPRSTDQPLGHMEHHKDPRTHMASSGPRAPGGCDDAEMVLTPPEGLTWCFCSSISPHLATSRLTTRAAPCLWFPLQRSAFLSRRKLGQWVEGPGKLVGGKDLAASSAGGMEGKGTASTRLPFPKPPHPSMQPAGPPATGAMPPALCWLQVPASRSQDAVA